MVGAYYPITFLLDDTREEGRKASPKMEALKTVFGGGTIEFKDPEESKLTIKNNVKEKETEDEQSLRIYEADGDSGSSDEEY